MTGWKLLNLITMAIWLANAVSFTALWWLSLPIGVGMFLSVVCAMIIAAMDCAERVWPALKG